MAHFPLRQLEAELSRVVTTVSTEKNAEGMYVHRDDRGEAYKWGPHPERYSFHPVTTLAEADMIDFLYPICFERNGGAEGTHMVMVTFAGRNVPADAGTRGANGEPTRWNVSGTGLDDLSLTPSIALNASAPPASNVCRWHGFVGSNGVPPGHAG